MGEKSTDPAPVVVDDGIGSLNNDEELGRIDTVDRASSEVNDDGSPIQPNYHRKHSLDYSLPVKSLPSSSQSLKRPAIPPIQNMNRINSDNPHRVSFSARGYKSARSNSASYSGGTTPKSASLSSRGSTIRGKFKITDSVGSFDSIRSKLSASLNSSVRGSKLPQIKDPNIIEYELENFGEEYHPNKSFFSDYSLYSPSSSYCDVTPKQPQNMNDMVNAIELENDLESVDSYRSETTINAGRDSQPQVDLAFLRSPKPTEPIPSPATEKFLNSSYYKLKMTSPRVLADLMKQVEIPGPLQRLPNSPIVKSIKNLPPRRYSGEVEREYFLHVPPPPLTIPYSPSFVKEGTQQQREEQKKLRVESELAKSKRLNEYRQRQRMLIKEDIEITREQKIAEQELFKMQKSQEWKKKLSSCFNVDLEAQAVKTYREIKKKSLQEEEMRKFRRKKEVELHKSQLIEMIIEREDIHTTRRKLQEEERRTKIFYAAKGINKI